MLPRTVALSSSALLVLACVLSLGLALVSCGEGIEAAGRESRAPARVVPPEVRAERARLTAEVRGFRKEIAANSEELDGLEAELAVLGADEIAETVDLHARISKLRQETADLREELNAGLDQIAELSRSF